MGIGPRGKAIEELLLKGTRGWFGLGNNVKTIDAYADGVAISVKSLDVTAPTYQRATGITRRLKRSIDAIAEYKGNTSVVWNGEIFDIGAVRVRYLYVALPHVQLSPAQWEALEEMMQYASRRGVNLVYTVVNISE